VSPLIAPYFSYQYGPRVPLYCTAIGKSLLAFLKKEEISAYLRRVKLIKYTENTMTKRKLLLDDLMRIKEKGYAINFAEGVMGRAGIAAPIFNRDGLPIAAISIVLSPSEIKDHEVENTLSEKIIKTAFKISQKLTWP
jgi:DNA-binding IclR family transcriptional regulator